MKKILLMTLLALNSLTFADIAGNCYFQQWSEYYEDETKVRQISCSTVERVFDDFYFSIISDSGTRYYGNPLEKAGRLRYYNQAIGEEGNLIIENDGLITINHFSFGFGDFVSYGFVVYSDDNAVYCWTRHDKGHCSQEAEFEFGNYLRDFLSSPARKSR